MTNITQYQAILRNKGGWLDRVPIVEQRHGYRFAELPLWIWCGSLAVVVWALFTPNALFTAAVGLLLPVLVRLLWIDGEPPVLLFASFMQLLQASAAVFYANLRGVELADVLQLGGPSAVEASWLSFAGVVAVTLGMRVALIRRRTGIPEKLERQSRLIDPVRVFKIYLIALPCFTVVEWIAFDVPGLTQPLLAVTAFKWVLFFLLAHSVLTQRRHFPLLAIAFCIQFAVGLLAYFSEFKGVFFVLLVVMPMARYLFRGGRVVYFCLVAILVLVFGVMWTAIKQDYRDFLNQGTHQQVVVVTREERVERLNELVADLDWPKLEQASYNLLLRVSYVQFFGQVLDNVPENVPYENGRLWFDAVKHVIMPRLFFPNKEIIDDSVRTAYYTGSEVYGAERGSSISIGYIGESYIDFGRIGMFGPIFLLGLFYGFIYRFFIEGQPFTLLGCAIATSILLFGAYSYTIETANMKLLGGGIMSSIVLALLLRYWGRPFWGMITSRGRATPVSRPTRRF